MTKVLGAQEVGRGLGQNVWLQGTKWVTGLTMATPLGGAIELSPVASFHSTHPDACPDASPGSQDSPSKGSTKTDRQPWPPTEISFHAVVLFFQKLTIDAYMGPFTPPLTLSKPRPGTPHPVED